LSWILLLLQENRAQRVRDNKLNKSLSSEANGEDDSFDDMAAVIVNGDAADNC